MKKISITALAVPMLLLFFAGSCKKDNPVAAATFDRYNLITVDGNSLPVVVDSGPDWYEEVLTGRVDLHTRREVRNHVHMAKDEPVVGRDHGERNGKRNVCH